MAARILDFSTFNLLSLEKLKPDTTAEQFAAPCAENSTIRDYFRSLSSCGSGAEMRDLVKRLADVKRAGHPLILGVGGDVLDEGLSPVISDLLDRSIISALAMTGTAIFKDVEIACSGGLRNTAQAREHFAYARETAELINDGVKYGAAERMGLAEALGACLSDHGFEHNDKSLLVKACKCGIPVTAHVTMGAETAHFIPSVSGEHLGTTAYFDLRVFAAQIANLQGGIFVISGSSATLPEIFVKTLQAVWAMGFRVDDFGAGFLGGRGKQMERQSEWRSAVYGERVSLFNIEGPYGLLFQLVFTCLLDELSENC